MQPAPSRRSAAERVDETGRLVGQMHPALELPTQRLDRARPETVLFRSVYLWAVPLGPGQVQASRVGIQRPADVDAPRRHRQGSELCVLVQSSLSVIPMAITRQMSSGCPVRQSRISIVRIGERFDRTADDVARIAVIPSCLQQEIVSPPERQQPARDCVLRVLGALHVAKALGDDSADRRKRIFDAMVKLFQDQLLQLVGCLVLAAWMPAWASNPRALTSACTRRSRRLTF